ncbi:sodium:proton antiporter [Ignatzschineria cameli]|uniref:Sodium:proton antiporter n=1 Tax=Ignatzschineria cameli TaxID=2182793 RepID=A0A2U2AL17_9GAMM|nr:sodium:proton antiporter [Ignatzschineria cameli]PWD83800.1 sodium:proton antiporter [Ignatzschineria cameli]PWD88314.1 sodium:proton antiporter [Ignatzschineria cameli]PWD88701.1 sodium:proton antiporter [Ignatzschineria cameli]PWD89227.1 sodium:proton antiporter [Ignatzschineria cameli]
MRKALFFLLISVLPGIALAGGELSFDGPSLSPLWSIPFIGIILSIAVLPLFAPKLWDHHYGKIVFGWTLLFFIPLLLTYDMSITANIFAHALIKEYIPFILLLLVLFAASGGIHISGNLVASPKFNVSLLAIGTVLASVMGTTGAAMLLIRPILSANRNRKHRMHIPIFFIFLVANIGGGLTPLGDPPLFLGFLNGVDFFWTLQHMFFPVLIFSIILLGLFYLIDSYYFKKENIAPSDEKTTVVIVGKQNFLIILGVLVGIIISGIWIPGISWEVFGVDVHLENVLRDLFFIFLTIVSLKITSDKVRQDNNFNWHPIIEVAKIFAGIFLTIVPVITILEAGKNGAFGSVVDITHTSDGEPINVIYFWVTTVLSAFLDNAPTYLVFFKMAGAQAPEGVAAADFLMNGIPATLLAISMGTVFTGPLTYIGNAPNFMVKSMAEQEGIKMPSFFGYFFIAIIVLVPIYILLNFIFL